jgi:hypothetical protein
MAPAPHHPREPQHITLDYQSTRTPRVSLQQRLGHRLDALRIQLHPRVIEISLIVLGWLLLFVALDFPAFNLSYETQSASRDFQRQESLSTSINLLYALAPGSSLHHQLLALCFLAAVIGPAAILSLPRVAGRLTRIAAAAMLLLIWLLPLLPTQAPVYFFFGYALAAAGCSAIATALLLGGWMGAGPYTLRLGGLAYLEWPRLSRGEPSPAEVLPHASGGWRAFEWRALWSALIVLVIWTAPLAIRHVLPPDSGLFTSIVLVVAGRVFALIGLAAAIIAFPLRPRRIVPLFAGAVCVLFLLDIHGCGH